MAGSSKSSLEPLRDEDFDFWKANHLLNRAGFGGTPSQVRALADMGAMGVERAVRYIVEYDEVPPDVAADDDGFDSGIVQPPSADERRQLRMARQSGDPSLLAEFGRMRRERQRDDRRQMQEFRRWWMQRMIETSRPFEEKMTLFWHGHFATGYRAVEDSYHMLVQNELFRANAAGNFAALTKKIIRDPAMLRFLNNDQNHARRPNENLARELMELFTMGEGRGYDEHDIKEGARALTGYGFEDDVFRFDARGHDDGPKRIMGRTGNWDGDDFVDIIFATNHPSEFLCLKLYRFFVNDLPQGPDETQAAFMRKLAKKLRQSEYELRPVLRTLFESKHFYDDANVAAQIKSPTQLIVQMVRSLRTPARSVQALVEAGALMGQHLGQPPSVKGWEGGRSWINTSTLFVRQNLAIYLLTGRRPDAYEWETEGGPYDAGHILDDYRRAGGSLAPVDISTYLLRLCLGAPPQPQRVETLVRFAESCGGDVTRHDVLVGLLALAAAMPEYQLC